MLEAVGCRAGLGSFDQQKMFDSGKVRESNRSLASQFTSREAHCCHDLCMRVGSIIS